MYEPHADGALGPLLCSRALRLQGCWRTCVSGSCTCEGVQRVSPAKRKGVPAVGLGVKKLSLKGWGGSCLAEGWEPTAVVGLGRRLALGRENGGRPENRRLQRGPAELRLEVASRCFSILFLKPHFKGEREDPCPRLSGGGLKLLETFLSSVSSTFRSHPKLNRLFATILVQATFISYLDERHSFSSRVSSPTAQQPK